MTPEEAIELLKGMQSPLEDYAELVGAPAFAYGHKYAYPYPQDYAIEEAIEALKEIQLYKDNKLCLVPEDVYSRQCSELDAYKEIGTVEECRKAVEKQKPKKPHRNYKKFSGLWCKCGWYLGQKQCLDIKYCPNCGQAIDENLEGMEENE